MSRALFALAAAVPPLVVYARTMAPGLLARGDVPKFQYLGVVLGTAHAPGYPLFVQLSWLFSQLPIGTVAWRVNLMTMLFGVAAACATAWAARACGAPRPAALVAAWGLAFGPVFWEQATAAEVYTLAAFLQASVLALVLRWQRTRRDAHLLQAVAVSALALGHHPTFAMAAPALAVFVLVVDRRVVTRARVLIGSAALIVLGLAQYLFIVWRTRQGALYLEARADDVRGLVAVLRGSQYDAHLFAFTPAEVFVERLPLVWRFIAHELTWAGVGLAAVGAVALLRRAPARALLLALTALLVFAFALTYDVGDVHVFVVPVFLVMWIAAAVGLGRAVEAVTPRHAAVACAAVAIGMSSWAVARAYAVRDLSRETWDARYAAALLDQVRAPATVLFDDYDPMSHAVRYMLFAERTGHRVRIGYAAESTSPDTDYAGARATYATEPSRAILEARGLLMGAVEIEARLTDHLRSLPPGAVVALALPPGAAGWLSPDDIRFLQAIGARRLPDATPYAALARDAALMADEAGARATASSAVEGRPFVARYADGVASVTTASGTLSSDRAGLVAAFDRLGEVLWVEELNRAAGVRPTFDTTRRALFRVTGVAPCQTVGAGGWAVFQPADIATRLSAWTVIARPREGRTAMSALTLYTVADDAPAALAGRSLGEDRPLDVALESFDRHDRTASDALASALAGDAAPLPVHGRYVTRVRTTIAGLEMGPAGVSALMALSPPLAVIAGASGPSPVRFCLPPVQGVVLFGDDSESRRELVRGESDAIGRGWHGIEGDGRDRLRWTSAARSVVRFSMSQPADFRVRLEAGPQVARPGDAVDLLVNGMSQGAQPLREGQQAYHWQVRADDVRAGLNEMTIVAPEPLSPRDLGRGSDPRPLGLGVRALFFERGPR